MRTFLVACLFAIVIAAGAVYVLDLYQRSADVAYSTSGTRI